MKVQIIQLDPQDDRASVSDRLSWAQAPRVLLVWPAEGRILARPLDLVLLQRQARRKGTQIGLVTRDPDVTDHARDLGIPVFTSADGVLEEGWRRRGRVAPRSATRRHTRPDLANLRPVKGAAQPPTRLAGALRWPIFLIGLSSVLVLASVVVPSAVVRLPLETEEQRVRLRIVLDPNQTAPESTGRIPSIPVSLRLREVLRLPTSGTTEVPDHLAEGTVLFTNLTPDPVTIPAGTGVRATEVGGARFVTQQEVTVPGGPGATVISRVLAEAPGTSGNVPPGAINAVEGALGLSVSVQNTEPTTGGDEASRAAVSLADRARLLRELTALLVERAEEELNRSFDPGTILATSSLRIVQEYLRSYDHEVGDAADALGLTMEVQVAGDAYRRADLETAAHEALEAARSGAIEAPGSLSLEYESEPSTDVAGQTWFEVTASRRVCAPPDFASLRPLLLGRSAVDAASALAAALDLRAAPVISLDPPWWPRMPWISVRVHFDIVWDE